MSTGSNTGKMIELLIGPYRSGKTGRLLRELVDFKAQNPLDECLILVPSHRYGKLLKQQMHQILEERSSTGIFGVQIATIYQCCQQIMRNAGQVLPVVSKDLCVRMVTDALQALHSSGELAHLDSIHEFAGTANALLRLFEEFERAALTPHMVLASLDATAAGSARQYELAKIYREYWRRLDEMHVVDQKRLALSCRELLAKKAVAGLHLRWLVVDGFDRISPLQAELIEGLARHAAETRIAFDYVLPEERQESDPQHDEYAWKDTSYNELHKRFLERSTIPLTRAETRPRQFAFTTLDMFSEMQETARRCKEAIVVRGIKADQILVVARDIQKYAPAAKVAFTQAGLPFFIDEAIEAVSLPWIKLVSSLAALAENDFPRRAVIDCLRSKYLDSERWGLKPADIDRLDRCSWHDRVISGREQWKACLSAENEASLLSRIEAFFDLMTPRAVQTMEAHSRWLEDLLDAITAEFGMRHAGSKQRKLLTPSEEETQALKAFRTALRTLLAEEKMFGQQTCSYKHFLGRLQTLLEGANFRRSEPHTQHIHICSAEHAPNRRYDEVFLVGAAEGQFPKHTGESGFVSADERSRWRLFGIELTNPREEAGFERALFRSLVERARKCFWASYPQLDMGGDEVLPSFYLTDGTLNHGAVESVDFSRQSLLQPTAPREAVSGWLWHSPGYTLADSMSAHAEIDEYFTQVGNILFGACQRQDSDLEAGFNANLKDMVSAGWLNVKLPQAWSASALNNYGQCPFKFWVSNMLDVDPRDEPEAELDIMEKGKLYHRILELYYGKLIARGLLDNRADDAPAVHEEILQAALQEAFQATESKLDFRPGPYWTNEKREIKFRVNRFLQFDAERLAKNPALKPALLEAKFGTHDSTRPTMKCQTAIGEIEIRGVVDRIDVERAADGAVAGATVIDYKTGSQSIPVADVRAGANLQIPLYALAVMQTILPGAKVTSGHYLSIGGAKAIGSIDFNSEKMADILDVTKARISSAVGGVASGDFAVRPYSSKACKTCDHRAVCRVVDLKRLSEGDD